MTITVNTYACALALCVAGLGVLVLITSTLQRRMRVLDSWRSTTDSSLRNTVKTLAAVQERTDKTSAVALAARVDELSEAVGKLAETHRKFAGRMDRRYQLERKDDEPADGEEVDDPTWIALRKAQQAQIPPT